MTLLLKLKLRSDATFGRGDGVAGLVDEEVEHAASTGLPFLRGRALKGLLVEECANLLFAVSRQKCPRAQALHQAAKFLFGQAGSTLEDDAMMHVGPAQLPREFRQAVEAEVECREPRMTPADVLESLTAVRRQTAVDEVTGAPEQGSLRSMRVVLRDTPFVAELGFSVVPDDYALSLLAACVTSLRRAGTGRNRGRGRLSASLCSPDGKDLTDDLLTRFKRILKGEPL